MSPHRITMADVARAAGVSQQTVSRAINNKGEISSQTRARVLKVVETMGYRPSNLARGLVTRRTLTVGVIVPDIANAFFAEIVRGAEGAAHAAGYSLLLGSSNEDQVREAAVIRTLEEKQVDGVVLCSPRLPDDELARCVANIHNLVLINRRLPGCSLGSVCNDDYAGARAAIRHLVATGRRVIGFLSGPRNSYYGRLRAQGYRDEVLDANLPLDPTLAVPCTPYWDSGQESAQKLLTSRPDVDAIFCFNDLVAAGALQACAELGRRVPDDVAIVGCDDIFIAQLMTPSLTTLRAKKRQLGAAAVEVLLDRINGRERDGQEIVFQPELIVRDSAPGAATVRPRQQASPKGHT